MAQIVEKQTFCNVCADLEIKLDEIILEEEQKCLDIVEQKQEKRSKELSRLFNKAKHNANYLNEIVKIDNYKAKIDNQVRNHLVFF
jgi:hypothetical protein